MNIYILNYMTIFLLTNHNIMNSLHACVSNNNKNNDCLFICCEFYKSKSTLRFLFDNCITINQGLLLG